MRFVLPLPPPINHTYRAAYRPSLGRTAFFMDARATAWKKEAERILKTKRKRAIGSPVEVFVLWFLARDRDCDSGLKLVLDALKGTVIEDDNQVQALHAFKEKDARNPRVEVEVWEIES
ncbi:MAG: RusA family crossover junction endodeoxyribonuclease [Synergistales bacterium]|nr:RusA family crossover junction endodeoxyribonuclease [Synergistales bacterium]